MLNSCKCNRESHSCWIKTTIVRSFFGQKSKEFPELAHVLSSLKGSNITALHFWPKPIVVLLLCSLLNLPISAYFSHSLPGLVVTVFHVWRKTHIIANRKGSYSRAYTLKSYAMCPEILSDNILRYHSWFKQKSKYHINNVQITNVSVQPLFHETLFINVLF